MLFRKQRHTQAHKKKRVALNVDGPLFFQSSVSAQCRLALDDTVLGEDAAGSHVASDKR